MKKNVIVAVLMAVLLALGGAAQAELFRVGPSDVPSPPGHGYPFWYQDTNGLALDLCVPENDAQNAPCLAAPEPGDPPFVYPFVFPTNWPGELFWFGADASMDLGNGNDAILVQALEAAFAAEDPIPGDQISFGRIRIRIDAPVAGTYTVTFPYGQETFVVTNPGRRAINFTSDVGIGAPGDFTGALRSAIGPFLRPVENDGATFRPFFELDGHQFLSDGVTPTRVTGSPFTTNFFRVCVDGPSGLNGSPLVVGVNDCMQTDEFLVFGRVRQEPIGSPLEVKRATYSRDAASAHIDVFAVATPGPGQQTPSLSFADAGGTLMATTQMAGPDALDRFYGQGVPFDPENIPASIIVVNTGDDPPSSVTADVTDLVNITQAFYNPETQEISITATSSDRLFPPELSVIGLPGSATGTDALVTPVPAPVDPAEKTLSINIGPVAPESITVVSSAGGRDSEKVSTQEFASPTNPDCPVARDDSAVTQLGVPVDIDVLANDCFSVPANDVTIEIVTQPSVGLAEPNLNNGVTYTPGAATGDFTFTYRLLGNGLQSNTATVTVTVETDTAPGPAPILVNDGPFTVQVNGTVDIPIATLLGNDDSNGGTINAATFTLVGTATGGTATIVGGNVTFQAGAVPGTFGFSYNVANTNGQFAATAAQVSVQVEDLPPAPAPILINDGPFDVFQNGSVDIPIATLLSNDNPNGGTIDPANFTLVGTATGGTATIVGGNVVFQAGAVPGTFGFSYNVANTNGQFALTPAQVTVNVVALPPEVISITRAEYRTLSGEWRVEGANNRPGNIITIHLGPSTAGPVIGTTTVDALGQYRFRATGTGVGPGGVRTVTVRSSTGAQVSGTLTVRF